MTTVTFIILLPIVIAACNAIGFALAFFLNDIKQPQLLIQYSMGLDAYGNPDCVTQAVHRYFNFRRAILWRS